MEAAGIIALVRATSSTAFQARTLCLVWKDAPRDVFFLRDELDTCRVLFDSMQSGIVDSSLLSDLESYPAAKRLGGLQREALEVLLRRGERIVTNLGEILVELLGGHAENKEVGREIGLAFRKKILWLRRVENVSKFRKMLRRTVDDITLCLTMLNVKITAITATYGATVETDIVGHLTDTVESTRQQIENALERSTFSIQENIQAVIDRRLEESFMAMATRFEDNLLSDLRSNQRLRLESEPSLKHNELHGAQGVNRAKEEPSRSEWAPGPPARLPRLGNHLQILTLSDTESRCRCGCHQSGTSVSSGSDWELPWLQHVLGSLRISYRSLSHSWRETPSLSKDCGSPSHKCCMSHKKQACSSIIVQYQFPTWLARTVLFIYFLHHGRPELLIRVGQVISTSDHSFTQTLIGRVSSNDIESVKRILEFCPSSINDITEQGHSALLHAVGHRRTLITRLLLRAGADPFQENATQSTAARAAVERFIEYDSATPSSHQPDINALVTMIPISRVLDEDGYTELHRVAIGVLPLKLEDALENPAFHALIHDKTATGLTVLHLAAQTRKTSANEVRQLLIAGADPNAVTDDGRTPLSCACSSGNKEALEVLLAAGASPQLVSQNSAYHSSMLHFISGAAPGSGNPSLIDLVLKPEYGININGVNDCGITPLAEVGMRGDPAILGALIERGANLDTSDYEGDTPLHETIFFRRHQLARILLGLDHHRPELRGNVNKGLTQRYRYVNNRRGWGICHYLADEADGEMMGIFAELGMTGLSDPATFADVQGRTALDLFQARTGVYVPACGPCPTPPPPPPPPPPSGGVLAEDAAEESTQTLVRAWRNLLESINRGGGDHREDAQEDCNHGGDETDDEDEFFDAREHCSGLSVVNN